jgi:hypothetical protein
MRKTADPMNFRSSSCSGNQAFHLPGSRAHYGSIKALEITFLRENDDAFMFYRLGQGLRGI